MHECSKPVGLLIHKCVCFISGSLDNKLHNYEILHSISVHSVVKRSPGAVPRTEMDLSMFGK